MAFERSIPRCVARMTANFQCGGLSEKVNLSPSPLFAPGPTASNREGQRSVPMSTLLESAEVGPARERVVQVSLDDSG